MHSLLRLGTTRGAHSLARINGSASLSHRSLVGGLKNFSSRADGSTDQTMPPNIVSGGSITDTGVSLEGLLIGLITDINPHPAADRLKVCSVEVEDRPAASIGSEEGEDQAEKDNKLQIICGADNFSVGDKVAVATIGTKLMLNSKSGEKKLTKIKKSKLRGVLSQGMLCSEAEIGISEEHNGILILNKDAPIGKSVVAYLKKERNLEENAI